MYSMNLNIWATSSESFSYATKIFVIATVITRNKSISNYYQEKEKKIDGNDRCLYNESFKWIYFCKSLNLELCWFSRIDKIIKKIEIWNIREKGILLALFVIYFGSFILFIAIYT